ncbi:MAG: cytochrome b [Gammaproteobacteria bacterium]
MPMFNERDAYGWMAMSLHWLLFLLIAGLVASGKYSDSLGGSQKIMLLLDSHKQIGVAVFALMLFRLCWRLINKKPEGVSDSTFISIAAFATHWMLYITVLLQALIGICVSQLFGHDVSFLGVLQVPSFVDTAKSALDALSFMPEFIFEADISHAKKMRALHYWGGNAIMFLVAVHVLGALTHHYLIGDDTLRRMIFGYKPAYAKEKDHSL